jgi:orotate phosphoribosyltransferase
LQQSISSTIAKNLLQIKAIKLSPHSPFTWASGIQSPIYCDNRISLAFPQIRKNIIDGFVNLAEQYSFDAIVGVATAGIPHGVLLAEALGLPFAYVRAKSKEHGRQNLIEGDLAIGSKVLVIEDLISTGGSCLSAVTALKQHGLEPIAVLAIFQYGFSFAEKAFEEQDMTFETLTDDPTLLNVAIENGYIDASEQSILSSWSVDPHNWTPIK